MSHKIMYCVRQHRGNEFDGKFVWGHCVAFALQKCSHDLKPMGIIIIIIIIIIFIIINIIIIIIC